MIVQLDQQRLRRYWPLWLILMYWFGPFSVGFTWTVVRVLVTGE